MLKLAIDAKLASTFLVELAESRFTSELRILCAWVAIEHRPACGSFSDDLVQPPRSSWCHYLGNLNRLFDFADSSDDAFQLRRNRGSRGW